MAKKNNPPPPEGGLLIVRKPVGITSMDVIRQLRRMTHIKKIGHTGTLDPFADGVLPVAIGRATNMIHYMEAYDKRYRVLLHLGQSTDTHDLTGQVLQETPITPEMADNLRANNWEKIKSLIEEMTGSITQVTPQFSAAKIDGKPMYYYARQGIQVEGKTRKVEIYSVSIVDIHLHPDFLQTRMALASGRLDNHFPGEVYVGEEEILEVYHSPITLVLDIHCSKGTYIRTWVDDFGRRLGWGAYAEKLRRISAGPYTYEDSLTLEALEMYEAESFRGIATKNSVLLSPGTARLDFPMIELEKQMAINILQGKAVYLEEQLDEGQIYRVYNKGKFLGLGVARVTQNQNLALFAERMFTGLENIKN